MRRRVWLWWLYALALAVPALCGGLATAQTDYPFGPHEATYEVTIDSRLTVDLGPLGAAVLRSPLPGPLGFVGGRVVVGPIPADLATTYLSANSLAQDLMDYGQAYLGIGETLHQAVMGLIRDGLVRAGIAWSAALTATVVVALLLGRARRNQLIMWLRRYRRAGVVVVSGLLLVGVAVGAGLVQAAQPRGEPAPEALLAGTPFEGAHLTGRLGQLVSQYGKVAVDAYEENVDFYARAAASVEEAFAAQAETAARRPEGRDQADQVPPYGLPLSPEKSSPVSSSSAGSEEAPPLASGPAAASPSASASPTPPWLRGKDPYGGLKPAVFFSDLHCNTGMAQVVAAAARATGSELVLDGGDTTMDGTSVERYCIDQIAAALPDDATWVTAPGNHDTKTTAEQERAAGAVVLDGKVERVAGLRILGDADPTHTELAVGTSLVGEESLTDVGERLARTACEDGPVDLLLVHQPLMTEAPLDSGCVPAAVVGHMHSRINPKVVRQGVRYQQASTGRDNSQSTTIGPLVHPAELTILLFNDDGAILAWQILTVNPDASAELSQITAWPKVPAADEPEGGAGTSSEGASQSDAVDDGSQGDGNDGNEASDSGEGDGDGGANDGGDDRATAARDPDEG
jgi:hypothetical protein